MREARGHDDPSQLAPWSTTVRLTNSWLYSDRLHSHLFSCPISPHCVAFITLEVVKCFSELDLWKKSYSIRERLHNQSWGNCQKLSVSTADWKSKNDVCNPAKYIGFYLTLLLELCDSESAESLFFFFFCSLAVQKNIPKV